MITGAIKNKIDKIWLDIAAGGVTNPLTVIEQLTYLMFIRSLDEKEIETEEFENLTGKEMDKIFPQTPNGQSMRWSKFKDRDPVEIFNIISQRVFPAIKKMKNSHLPDFNEQGELIEIEGEETSDNGKSAFSKVLRICISMIYLTGICKEMYTNICLGNSHLPVWQECFVLQDILSG